MFQPPLPAEYRSLPAEALVERIARVKARLADRLIILGHHYQRDEVIRFADFTGDSLKLARTAAAQRQAEFIVFCGVHFMAESADILAGPGQKVLLPDLSAGCSMADMAAPEQVEACWRTLQGMLRQPERLVPVTYVNSSATIKAFCGRHDGLCCTSGNARAVLESIWRRNPRAVLLFLPDQHLGRNTGYVLGRPLDAMPLWDPYQSDGGLSPERADRAALVLWDGFCSVHQEFTVEQIQRARAADPAVQVIVHPECRFEVVQEANHVGSTEGIIRALEAAPTGSRWAVGTEINLVQRLARRMAQRHVQVASLSNCPCLCETMYRIDLPHLAWLLESLERHCREPARTPLMNRVVVDEPTKQDARRALEKMLELTDAPASPTAHP